MKKYEYCTEDNLNKLSLSELNRLGAKGYLLVSNVNAGSHFYSIWAREIPEEELPEPIRICGQCKEQLEN